MKSVLQIIQEAYQKQQKLLAILLDPDKLKVEEIPIIISRIKKSNADFIFVGGSVVTNHHTDAIVEVIKKETQEIPIVLFPGDANQITDKADALLFLNLISGNNPEYLIKQQIKSAEILQKKKIEVIPTGYILINGGTTTSTMLVSNTTPIEANNTKLIKDTAYAAELMGKKIVYLEAGSGAIHKVNPKTIKIVSDTLHIPIIVGGGLKTKEDIQNTYLSGATLAVIGTAFEEKRIFTKPK